MTKSYNKFMSLKKNNVFLEFIKGHEKIAIFIFFFITYNLNFRNIASGDNAPATLLPFTILNTGTLYLDSFIPYFQTRYHDTYFLLNSHGHFVSFFPIVTPVLVTPLYVIPYVIMKFWSEGFGIYDPHLYLIIDVMEKISASTIASLACVFIFLIVKKLFCDKIAWITTITFGLATNTWSTSSQSLWQHGMVELLLVIMIYLVLLIEQKDSIINTTFLGLLSGLFIFNRPPDSVLLLPIIIYIFFLKRKAWLYYFISMIIAAAPFAYYNIYMLGGFFGGYNNNLTILTLGTSTLVNIFGLLFSPNRGLFVYSPIIIISLLGMSKIYIIKNRKIRTFLYLFIVSLLLNILVYASFNTHWWGGWCYGPRFLSGMLPIIIIYLAVFLYYVEINYSYDQKKIYTYAFMVLFGVSFFIQIVGSFYYPNGGWDAVPNIDYNTERLWKWDDNQIITEYKAGTSEPYFLQILEKHHNIITNGKLISGWQGLEPSNGVPTRWMENNGTIETYFLKTSESTIHLTLRPLNNDLKCLQVKVNGKLISEKNVNGLTELSLNASFSQGINQIVFYSPYRCIRPADIPELNSEDLRCLSFSFQNITIEKADVVVF